MIQPATNATAESGSATADCSRRAFYLTSQGRPLFAWLHEPPPGSAPRRGVVVCPPAFHEQVHSHRSLRHLADALARAGFVVCRFDYFGSGDSAGRGDEAGQLAAWEANVADVAAWMRDVARCQSLSLVGLRLGGLLAMRAAEKMAVDDLVVWAPIVKGRQYVRELEALSLSSESGPNPTSDIEAAGFFVGQSTAREIADADALALHPRCRRALVVARDDLSDDRRLVDRFASLGVAAEQTRQPGYSDMMAEPHKTIVPTQAIAAIIDWLLASPDAASTPLELPDKLPDQMTADGCRESIVRVEGEAKLFGVLCEPEDGSTADRPLVALINAGAAYRIGPNRLYVSLARRLAAAGFRSLRMDVAGLGDSVVADPSAENAVYCKTIFRDIDRILNHAASRLGARRIVLAGLCSGAYATFVAAARFANPALVEGLSINPLTFFWKPGMSLDTSPVKEVAAYQYYAASALRPEKWWKLLTGQTRIGLFGAVAMIGRRLGRRGSPEAAGAADDSIRDGDLAHPDRESAAADLRRAVAAGRRLAFFFAKDDPGYPLLMLYAGRTFRSLVESGAVEEAFIPGADHTFSRRHPREMLIDAIREHLKRRYA